MEELIQMKRNSAFYIENKSYLIKVPKEGHIFDENKSLKWNRAQRELLIQKREQANQYYSSKIKDARENMWVKLLSYCLKKVD